MPPRVSATLLAASAANAMAGTLYAWSAMIPALEDAFGVGTGAGGMVFSLAILSFTAAVLAGPHLPARLRGLTGTGRAALAGAAALVLAVAAPGFGLFLAAFSLGFAAASGIIYLNVLDLAGRSARPALATPAMVACFGLGAVTFGPALRALVAVGWGIGALLVPAAGLALSALPALFLGSVRHGTPPMPARAPRRKPAATPAECGALALLWAGFFTGSVAGLMTLGLATTIIESRGATVALSGLTLAGIAIANTSGRLGAGALATLLPLGALLPVAALMSIAGLGTAALTRSAPVTALALIAIAAGYGLTAAGFPVITRALTGAERFAPAFAAVFTAWGMAGLLGPWAAGRLFDRTGGFTAAFTIAAGAALAALALSLLLARRLASSRHSP